MNRPMLGDLDLEQVQIVETDEDQVVTHHPVASLDGGFVQPIGRRAAQVRLVGVLTAAPTLETLAELRTKFHDAQPVPFVSDISTATLIDEVLIEAMDVREMAGTPQRLEYRFLLREYIEPEPIDTGTAEVPPTEIPDVEHGQLSVTVVVEGDSNFDFDRVQVSVEGEPDEGAPTSRRQLTNRIADNVWLEEQFPAGQYRLQALVNDNQTPTGENETLTGSAETRVENGEVASVTIVLRRGAKIGTVFITHFRFDSAFLEPCMRPVMRQVAQYASDHPDEKLLIVGHTDLAGPPEYNQSLSERRGRSVYAFMTFGSDPQAAINEWNELRRARQIGVLPASRDTWGSREYGQMLQDLGYFKGNVGADLDLTDAAVRQFQTDNGLSSDGDVGDSTWPVLIEQYLAQDNLGIAPDRFLQNANDTGCDKGPLRWLGCTEQDPVLNVLHAWRPNRRTELMFVKELEMPCQIPKPDTLELVPDGAGGGGWCLDDGSASDVCCFVTPADEACSPQETERWCRHPAEPATFQVSGRLQFSDGSPVANQDYVLIAPRGKYMDGEVKDTSQAVRAGTPIPGRTNADGRFSYEDPSETGIYTFEVEGPFVIHREGEPLTEARGNVLCARLDGSAELIVVVVDRAVAGISPRVTGVNAVVVKKPHTNPARQPITLGVSGPFSGTGTLTRSNDTIRFFDAAAGGNEILFDGIDNIFTDAQLLAGHQVFAQGERASLAVDDVTLTLALTVGGTPGLAAAHQMTSVLLTLDIQTLLSAAGADQGDVPESQKVVPGRPIQAQTVDRQAARVRLTIRQIQPSAFVGTLLLARLNDRVELFANSAPAPGDVALSATHPIPSGTIPAGGLTLFCQGSGTSTASPETGYQLGLDGTDPEGDRVVITVATIEMIRADNTVFPLAGDDACHMVSKFVTNLNLPNAATFDGPPGAAPDPDTFRVQVRDLAVAPVPVGRVRITRGAAQVYTHDFAMVNGPGATLAPFRSNQHVRLVSNTVDSAHLAHQTPLVQLGDDVAASILIGTNLLGTVSLPVGRPPAEAGPKAIRTADVNFITVQGAASDPAAVVAELSRNWAQLAVRFNLVGSETVRAVTNVISLDFPGGAGSAPANGTITVDVTPTGGVATTVVANIAAGDTDQVCAQKLAAAISARPGLVATEHQHGDQRLVLVNRRTNVTFANQATTVAGLQLAVPALTFNDDLTALEGSILGLNFADSDLQTLDIIAVDATSVNGAGTDGATGGDFSQPGLPGWHNVSIIRDIFLDGSSFLPGHEVAHALLDGGNDIHARAPFQLPTSPIATNIFNPSVNADTIGGTKRLDAEQNTRMRAQSDPTTPTPILQAR